MNAQYKLVSTGPQESCRTDYSSHTFKNHTEEHEQEMHAYVYDLAEKVLPTGKPLDVTKATFFDVRYSHPSGIQWEISARDSSKSTKGSGSLVIPGSCWGALNAPERRDLIVDIYQWPGYYRTTRWDAQLTVLDPPITIYEIIEEVAAGRLWAARINSQQSWERRDRDGLIIEPPTQYFGSPQSKVRVRIYDHGAKHDWQIPSLRVETQLRKETANQHFARLGSRCLSEIDADPLFVAEEARTVKDALMQHADLKDTSMWAGRRKPRNWAAEAPRPAWYAEMLQHTPDPLQIAHKAELDLNKTMRAKKEQYGRKGVLWAIVEAFNRDVDISAVLRAEFISSCSKLKKGDDDLVASLVPPEKADEARAFLKESQNLAAQCSEHGDWP